MNCYEHTFITKQDLSEDQVKGLVTKYENLIQTNSGKILKIEEWGLRNLSYIINNNKKGFYLHFKLEGEGKTIEELEKAENIDESLIRYLTVRVKKHDLENNYFKKDNYMSDSCFSFRGKEPMAFLEKISNGMIQILLHPMHYSNDALGYDKIVVNSFVNYMENIHKDFLLVNSKYRQQFGKDFLATFKRIIK